MAYDKALTPQPTLACGCWTNPHESPSMRKSQYTVNRAKDNSTACSGGFKGVAGICMHKNEFKTSLLIIFSLRIVQLKILKRRRCSICLQSISLKCMVYSPQRFMHFGSVLRSGFASTPLRSFSIVPSFTPSVWRMTDGGSLKKLDMVVCMPASR
jgi:hypothetical protein